MLYIVLNLVVDWSFYFQKSKRKDTVKRVMIANLHLIYLQLSRDKNERIE